MLIFVIIREQWTDELFFGTSWNEGSQFYVHTNVERYGLYLGLQAVGLNVSNGCVALMPTDQMLDLKIYDTETGRILPASDLGLNFDSSGDITVSNDQLSSNGGYAVLWAYQGTSTTPIDLEDPIRFCFVVRDEEDVNNGTRFLPDEIEYFTMCLDLFFSLYKVSDPVSYVDKAEMNTFETYIFSISKLSDILSDLIKQQGVGEAQIKKALGDFIQEYVDDKTAHTQAKKEAEIQKEMIKFAMEFHGDNWKKVGQIPDNVITVLNDITSIVTAMEIGEALSSEIARLEGLTQKFHEYFMNAEGIRNADNYHVVFRKKEALLASYKTILDNNKIIGIDCDEAVLNIITSGTDNMKVVFDGLPNAIDTTKLSLDFYLYVRNDYENNIAILELMRKGMIDSGVYSASDTEVVYINDLIEAYQNKWESGIADFLADYSAKTIENIASATPVATIVSTVATIINEVGEYDSKIELHALSDYRTALNESLAPIDKLYFDGVIDSNTRAVKQYVTLYLGIMEKSNELSIQIANSVIPDLNEDERQKNLDMLQEQLEFIRELQQTYGIDKLFTA